MTLAVAWFQSLLFALGSALAWLYQVIPNYGVAIILLTLAIRVVLLPLGIKQIRSMQAMQSVQPKVKALQQKYKGNRQKLNEEMMLLYKEHGVNPLSGCLPLLLQFPVLIALFAVLRVPGGLVHIPKDSRLHGDIQAQRTEFLGANMLCSAIQAGKTVKITYPKATPESARIQGETLKCGKGIPVRIPFYVFAVLMVGTTYYQQRQMQRASPAGSINQQQQTLTRVMPVLFGVWGFIFPSGLVVYWTTTNLVQIAQQHFMLPKVDEEEEDSSRPKPAPPVGTPKPRRWSLSSLLGEPLGPPRGQTDRPGGGKERKGSGGVARAGGSGSRGTGNAPKRGTGGKPAPKQGGPGPGRGTPRPRPGGAAGGPPEVAGSDGGDGRKPTVEPVDGSGARGGRPPGREQIGRASPGSRSGGDRKKRRKR
jgi:YidC/Oxa1 family membrane protein insertase